MSDNGLTEAMIKQWCAQALSDRPIDDPRFPPSAYYRFLKIAARNLKSRLSVELGVCGGGGILHMAMGWPEGQVVGIDQAWDHEENLNYVLESYPNVKFILGDSTASAPKVHKEHGEIDLLFIDTEHTYKQSMAELEAYRPYLSKKAIVCFDDLFRSEMGGVWSDLPGDKVRLDVLHGGAEHGGGFGVIWNI